ncbi:MAG: SpoIID/LytB domain-containing protein, partial [Pseudanabaenaceae cyanobacterium]
MVKTTLLALSLALTFSPALAEINPILKVGIVQRFGRQGGDRLLLEAPPGEQLQLRFGGRTIPTQQVNFTVVPELLPQPQLEERVVLSYHRSFENAQASAHRWQSLGINTEIVQPDRWQVWAKRSDYDNPVARRLLLQKLRFLGNNVAQLESRWLTSKPVLQWEVNGTTYRGTTVDISTRNGIVLVNRDPYPGSFRLQPNAFGSFTLVNFVPLETYLRGVVPHEIGYQAPYSAVQAQAVLARTYALANRHRFTVDDYEICATTHCQVYEGLKNTSPLADRAIQETRGKVLTYGGKVVDALYSSTTGGITANFHDLWDGNDRPYLRAVFDTVTPPPNLDLSREQDFRRFINLRRGFNEEGWRTFRWEKFSSLEEMATTLREFLRKAGDNRTNFQRIRSVAITERSRSGRVLKMVVQTDGGTITIEKDEIRDAFHAPGSTLFYLEPQFNAAQELVGYKFVGGGLGHGVGMSQTGAYRLSRMGWSYERILAFYFRGTTLETL